MKKFVTLFNTYNVHLIKDVGMIPYGLQRYGFYDAYITTYDSGDHGYFSTAVKGLNEWKIPHKTGNYIFDALLFLWKNASKIDVLNCYHTTTLSAMSCAVYKIRNRRGKIYIKLDGGDTKEESIWWKRPIRGFVMRHADIVSTELYSRQQELEKSWKRNIEVIRNPYHPNDLKEYRSYNERKNTIITVGRIGTTPKNTETLLDAFLSIADLMPEWKLLLVGPVEPFFREQMDELFSRVPLLKHRIILYGNVESRDELMHLYSDAKIFVFPSRWESYGIALMEAGLCGTFQVCSDLVPSKELTHDFEYAARFPAEDVDQLAKLLLDVCKGDSSEIEHKGQQERAYIIDTCSLKQVCVKLNQMLASKK